MSELSEKTKVFYDGQCAVCSREIDMYMRVDNASDFSFVDISDLEFDASMHGLKEEQVNSEFHVITKDGKVLKGVDAFVEIWSRIPSWNIAASLARIAPIRFGLNCGYSVFVKIRPYLPRKK